MTFIWAKLVGFESISHSREEFLFPPKKSIRIMVLALTAGGISYALLSLMAVSVLPPEYDSWTQYIPVIGQLGGTKGLPVFYATEEALGDTGSLILGITLLGGIITGLVGNYIAASRLIYALGREGIMPPRFGKSAGFRHTLPFRCFFLTGLQDFDPSEFDVSGCLLKSLSQEEIVSRVTSALSD